MSSFSLDLEKFAKKAGDNAAAVVKKVALDLSSQVVIRTPVDTGRARGNWQMTFNSPANGVTAIDDKSGQMAISSAGAKLKQWISGDIWLTNNLPYIRRLEYGWSKQAPSGMVKITVREFQSYVNKAATEVNK